MRLAGLVAAAAVLVAAPTPAEANPSEGEARGTTRDADRVYTVVAGEGDGASTVVNPANLGFLNAVNGVLDVAATTPAARRRGSGAGAFVGIPLPFRLAAVGLGFQYLFRPQPSGGSDQLGFDDPYGKVSFALAVPLFRWVRGMSLGASYSRLASTTNFHANTNELSLAWAYWPNRFLALGLVGRGLNSPRTGESGEVRQPLVVDPEVALRPLGTPALELAVGTRIIPSIPADAVFKAAFVEPRVRLMSKFRGVGLFAGAERFQFNPVLDNPNDPIATQRTAVRMTAGMELSFGHLSVAAAPTTSANGRSTFSTDGGAFRVRLSQERYPTITTSPRRVTRIVMSSYRGDRGMWRLIELMDGIASRGGTVLIETRGMGLGWAQTEEIREAVLRLRARGGKVAVYMEGGSLRSYFLASAGDYILAHPTTKLGIIGMRIQSFYYGDLLAKLGVRADFVRFAEYKSSPEHYSGNTATAPSANQRLMRVSDAWNHALRLIARERGHQTETIKGWIDQAPLTPSQAEELGVVDGRVYRDELDATLEAWLDRPVRINKPDRRKAHAGDYGPAPHVAVVMLNGDMVEGKSFTIPILGRKLAGSETLTAVIRKLRKDATVRAIVLRCNTGGGSVTAAEAIARELDLARKVKPVVISMSNACASGGYYAATSGQYIFADATTLTGSIGVFQPKLDFSGTRELLGVGMDEYNFGAHAGMWSHFKPYTPAERRAAERKVAHDYSVFSGRVSKARSMTPKQVDGVARGRIWSGVRASEIGLVDQYGGLREAVVRARAIAGMSQAVGEVALYPKPPGPLKNLRALLGFKIPGPLSETDQGGTMAERVARSPMGALSGGGANVLGYLPLPILAVLRQVPAALWLSEADATMALAEDSFEILD